MKTRAIRDDRPGGPAVVPVFRALACEARVCIVRELSAAEEMCVCDLVGCCGLGWSTVSHHLSILREAGIVADEKRGQQVYYRLVLSRAADFIRCLEDQACGSEGAPMARISKPKRPTKPTPKRPPKSQ